MGSGGLDQKLSCLFKFQDLKIDGEHIRERQLSAGGYDHAAGGWRQKMHDLLIIESIVQEQ